MTDLAEFLLARIAEDEERAKEVPAHFSLSEGLNGDGSTLQHFQQWTPNRVLLECEAKRQIVETHQNQPLSYNLRCLALVYADHEDYRQEWRP